MTSKTTNKFSLEVRTCEVRMALDHGGEYPSRWAAIEAIAPKIGCSGAGVPTDVAEKLKALERENRELRQANEILRTASAYFATTELDRRSKP